MNQYSLLIKCAQYIIDTEYDDYREWCADNGLDYWETNKPENQKHIYAVAYEAMEGNK